MSETVFEPTGIMGQQIFGLAVDRKTLFSNHKNVYKKRIEMLSSVTLQFQFSGELKEKVFSK